MTAKRRVEVDDITAAQRVLGVATRQEVRIIERGRAYDPVSRRWYKNGFAPWQLAWPLSMTCGLCGYNTLTVTLDGVESCSTCNERGGRFVP